MALLTAHKNLAETCEPETRLAELEAKMEDSK